MTAREQDEAKFEAALDRFQAAISRRRSMGFATGDPETEARIFAEISKPVDAARATLLQLYRAQRAAGEQLEQLEQRGVESIYFRDGSQLNTGVMSLRAALAALRSAAASTPTDGARGAQ